MNLKDRHNRIAILMVISQLLLVSFSIYWLNGQFREEKRALEKKLYAYYKESQQVVIDSILIKHIINPALGDSVMRFTGNDQRTAMVMMADKFTILAPRINMDPPVKGNDAVVKIMLDSGNDTTTRFRESQFEGLSNEMLLRSVRLIVQQADDSNSVHLGAFYGIDREPDSALFISDFEARLVNGEVGLKPVWIQGVEEGSKIVNDSKTLVIGMWETMLPSAIIKNYNSYILKQIYPQVLFAFILILLTGSAFLLAYSSLRKQVILNEMRNNFISNISHELKTPVSTVKLALETVRNIELDLDPVVAAGYLEMASIEIKRLELLITRVLDNSIIEQDGSVLKFEKVDLVTLINESIGSLKPWIDEANASVKFNHSGLLVVDTDPLYLQGVIINLFDNSLKYGNGNPEIEVDLSRDKGKAQIIVSDNGPGIPDKYLNKVFEKFFRLPTNDVHNVKGYGLGLSFAALVVRLHHGTIEARNNAVGCSFIIRIPIIAGEEKGTIY